MTAPSEPGAALPAEDIDAAQASATTATADAATADAATADAGANRPRRKRHVLVIVLIVITSLLAFVTALGTWVRRQALDTDAWVSASNEVLADPVVRDALSTYVVNELYKNVDVAGQFREQLPDNLKGLAGPLAGALRSPATEAVDRLLATSQFRSLWEQVNRRAHETLVRILEDKTRAGLSTAEGTVTLDLGELLQEVGQQLGLPSAVLDRIPADASDDGGAGSTPGTGSAGTAAELERLQALHASGGLTDEEFAAAKAGLLGSSAPAATSTAEQPS